MHDQHRFNAVTQQAIERAPAAPFLLLDRQLRIRAASSAYERATLQAPGELSGRLLFDALPDNPDDPQASGVTKLALSLETVMRSRGVHNMWLQRYDIADPANPGTFLPKVWEPRNSALVDHGELLGTMHEVVEVSQPERALAAIGRAIASGEIWSGAEVLHTLVALTAPQVERQQQLAAENEQLRRAIDTRDTIGQAKGMLMERFDIDAEAAFTLLVRLSQNTNTPLEQIARKLIASGPAVARSG